MINNEHKNHDTMYESFEEFEIVRNDKIQDIQEFQFFNGRAQWYNIYIYKINKYNNEIINL